jgi:hypothetical protein
MSLLRPAVVTDYQKTKGDNSSLRWQAYKLMTYALTAGMAAVLLFGQDYAGNGRGEHALSGVQAAGRRLYESVMLGELAPPGPNDLRRESGDRGGGRGGVNPAAGASAPPQRA